MLSPSPQNSPLMHEVPQTRHCPSKAVLKQLGTYLSLRGLLGLVYTEGWDYQLAVEAADEVAQWQALGARQAKM